MRSCPLRVLSNGSGDAVDDTGVMASCALSATLVLAPLASPAHAESASLSFETIPGAGGVELSAVS
ncbi:hypothetical protein, partial [Salinactinospora qingdaonensis]|uniref:hypothetical protein n=1 Tax=Salinactinospora qingdaonensis TaxID=702744 RepID=UPI0031ED64E2